MPRALYAARPGELEHGETCPECAGPKTRQSKRCADCYYHEQRTGAYPKLSRRGIEHPHYRGGRTPRARRTGSQSNPQPQSHPWRKDEALRLQGGA